MSPIRSQRLRCFSPVPRSTGPPSTGLSGPRAPRVMASRWPPPADPRPAVDGVRSVARASEIPWFQPDGWTLRGASSHRPRGFPRFRLPVRHRANSGLESCFNVSLPVSPSAEIGVVRPARGFEYGAHVRPEPRGAQGINVPGAQNSSCLESGQGPNLCLRFQARCHRVPGKNVSGIPRAGRTVPGATFRRDPCGNC